MKPADLYRTCQVSACRLETRQCYAGDEKGRQRAFLAGEPLPPPGPGKRADLRLITQLHQAGRLVQRVHVVDRPLSDYVRYELAVYAENEAAGEDVRIADRSAHPQLAGLDGDFVVFDAETSAASVIIFDYSKNGRLRSYKYAAGRKTVSRHRDRYALALERSVPLSEFMAVTG